MALFETIDEFKQYVSVDASMYIETLLPAIQSAEDKFIIDVLGQAQYDDLQSNYTADTLSSAYMALLVQAQKAIAPLAMYMYIPEGNVRMNDAGIMVTNSNDQNNAQQWRVDDLLNLMLFKGYDALDNLSNYLFANVGLFPLWSDSTAFTNLTQYFINTAADFQAQVDINKSNFLFQRMVPMMENIEIDNILDTIGQPFFDYLKGEIAADTLTGEDATAVKMIQKAVALLTMGRALKDPDFSELVNIFKRPRADAQQRGKYIKPDYSDVANTYSMEGEGMLKRAKQYIQDNASAFVFVAFFTSNRYQPPSNDKPKHNEFDNDRSKGSFMFM